MSADQRKYRFASDGINDALNRMKRAADRGTGCHLTAEMIDALAVSIIGDMWNQDDPRTESAGGAK